MITSDVRVTVWAWRLFYDYYYHYTTHHGADVRSILLPRPLLTCNRLREYKHPAQPPIRTTFVPIPRRSSSSSCHRTSSSARHTARFPPKNQLMFMMLAHHWQYLRYTSRSPPIPLAILLLHHACASAPDRAYTICLPLQIHFSFIMLACQFTLAYGDWSWSNLS
jgi:hypothetical protein